MIEVQYDIIFWIIDQEKLVIESPGIKKARYYCIHYVQDEPVLLLTPSHIALPRLEPVSYSSLIELFGV